MLKEIQSAFAAGRVKWRLHALQRMLERGIIRADIASVVVSGEIIETYPTGKPFPACLILALRESDRCTRLLLGTLKRKPPMSLQCISLTKSISEWTLRRGGIRT